MSASSPFTDARLKIQTSECVTPVRTFTKDYGEGLGPSSTANDIHQAVYHMTRKGIEEIPIAERNRERKSLRTQLTHALEQIRSFDLRPELPSWVSRFLGYRSPGATAPYQPIWALKWLDVLKIPLVVEDYVAVFFCTFTALLIICLVNSSSDLSHLSVPLSLGSAGATAVILFITPLTPAASPQSLLFGHLIASIVSTIVTRIFLHHLQSSPSVLQGEMSRNITWLCGCLAVALTIFFQMITGTVHPPGGATALLGAITPGLVSIGWNFVAFTLVMIAIMLTVAMVFGNVGRRSYPLYWFTPPPASASSMPVCPTGTEKTSNQPRTPTHILAETVQEFERLGFDGRELLIVQGAYQQLSQIS